MAEIKIGYTPTAEQIAAQQVRRAAQQAEKLSKKAKFGGKTIFDKQTGLYKALDAQQVKNIYLKNANTSGGFFSKIQETASNAWNGIKNTFSNFTSKFKTGSANSTGAGSKLTNAKNYLKGMGGKIKNGLKAAPSKVGRFFKGKGGKWALVGLAVAAATAAGVGIYKAVKGKSETSTAEANKPAQPAPKPTENNKPTEPPAKEPVEDEEKPAQKPAEEEPARNEKPEDKTTKPSDKKEGGTAAGAATGTETGSAANKTDKTNKNEKPAETNEETPEPPTVHKVVKGDNVWNIAKKHLEELNGKKPTNAEILKHTKELMEINGLEFEPDGKRVMIRPDDEIKLVA